MKKGIMSFLLAAGIIFTGGELAHASLGDNIVKTGEKYLGTPYKYGSAFGNTRSFDCSSFTSYVYSKNGITIPRTSVGQASTGKAVSKASLQKGDLIFYDTDFDGRINHAGIYAGKGKMLNAQSNGVAYTDAFSKYYWGSRFVTARRVITQTAAKPAPAAKKAPAATAVIASSTSKVHKVQKGETLWGISRKYKTTVASIQKWNNLKTTALRIGQSLKVSAPVPAAAPIKKASVTLKPVTAAKSISKKAIPNTSKTTAYVVKSGDSVWGISRTFHVSVNQIISSNKLKSSLIYPGQKLIIKR
jgi:LysM repeat protein